MHESFLKQIMLWSIVAVSTACGTDNDPAPSSYPGNGTVVLRITHAAGNQPLVFDSLAYHNAAGTLYGITKLQYYLSSITLATASGGSYACDSIFYIDAARDGNITLTSVPAGAYTQLALNIGIADDHNKTGYLPATIDHLNMAWSEAMGGGYHFMKMEGYYTATSGEKAGYAIHLGTRIALVQHQPIPCQLVIVSGKVSPKNLEMNINEWFAGPYSYRLEQDGNYTMSQPALMKLIAENGKDVFRIR